jgi:hypothetical protein
MLATRNLFSGPTPIIAMENERATGYLPSLRATEEATWGRIKYLFYEGPSSESVAINLNLVYPPGEDTWVAIAPPDPTAYPGETWYEKTVTYSLIVQMGDLSLVSFAMRASFVVRPVGDNWRIVQWRDDV